MSRRYTAQCCAEGLRCSFRSLRDWRFDRDNRLALTGDLERIGFLCFSLGADEKVGGEKSSGRFAVILSQWHEWFFSLACAMDGAVDAGKRGAPAAKRAVAEGWFGIEWIWIDWFDGLKTQLSL